MVELHRCLVAISDPMWWSLLGSVYVVVKVESLWSHGCGTVENKKQEEKDSGNNG